MGVERLVMSAFPPLQREVAAFQFMPTVEWHAERPHATMKMATTGKNACGRAASLARRFLEIRDIACHREGRSMLEKTFRFQAAPFALASKLVLMIIRCKVYALPIPSCCVSSTWWTRAETCTMSSVESLALAVESRRRCDS